MIFVNPFEGAPPHGLSDSARDELLIFYPHALRDRPGKRGRLIHVGSREACEAAAVAMSIPYPIIGVLMWSRNSVPLSSAADRYLNPDPTPGAVRDQGATSEELVGAGCG